MEHQRPVLLFQLLDQLYGSRRREHSFDHAKPSFGRGLSLTQSGRPMEGSVGRNVLDALLRERRFALALLAWRGGGYAAAFIDGRTTRLIRDRDRVAFAFRTRSAHGCCAGIRLVRGRRRVGSLRNAETQSKEGC